MAVKLPAFAKLNGAYLPHDKVEYVNDGPSMTHQEFQDECDVNQIMARFERTGEVPFGMRSPGYVPPQYVDLTAIPVGLHATMEYMRDASAAFMNLPAEVRAEFGNDPEAFVDFATDPENMDQMVDWGLATKRPDAPAASGGAPAGAPAGPPAGGTAGAPAPAPAAPQGASTVSP